MKSGNKSPDIKKVLFEPVAPYFADAYTTLTSVVQGLALGVLGYEIAKLFFENGSPNLDFKILESIVTGKLFLIFLFICLLWHRYIVHNQFYAWELGVGDTIIPISFGLLEALLILAVPKALVYSSFIFACISTLGVVAYVNTIQKHNDPPDNPKALALYKHHFASLGKDFAEAMFWEVTRFEKKAQIELIISSLIMWALTISLYCGAIRESYQNAIYFCVCSLILIRLMVSHLWNHLKKSPRLKPYWEQLNISSFN